MLHLQLALSVLLPLNPTGKGSGYIAELDEWFNPKSKEEQKEYNQTILFDVINALSEYLDNISVENALDLWNADLLYYFNHIDHNTHSNENVDILNRVISALSEYLDSNVSNVTQALELWGGDLLDEYNSISS